MDEKALKKLLAEQTKAISKQMDQRFVEQEKTLDKQIDQRFAEQDKKVTKQFKEQAVIIDTQLEDQNILMEQYVGALGEEYQASLKAALEIFTPLLKLPNQVRELKESNESIEAKLDITIEQTAGLTEVVQNHEERIQVLER